MYMLTLSHDINNIYILPSKSNYVLKHGKYNKILYSNQYITLNGLYIPIQLDNLQYSKKYNKYFLRFTNILNDIITLEQQLLSKYNNTLHHNTILKTSIENKRFVIDSKQAITSHHFILYISGLWENNYEVGIIFKILPANHLLPKNTD